MKSMRPGFAFVVAALLGITSVACSTMMGDLSQDDGDEEAHAAPDRNRGGAGNDDMLQETNGASSSSSSLQSNPDASTEGGTGSDGGMLTPTPTPTAPKAPSCFPVTLNPTSAVNVGVGQSWRSPQAALAGDGNNATTPLSVDNRESAYLQFGFAGGAVPANATVQGLMVDIARGAGSDCIESLEVNAIVQGGERRRTDVGDKWIGTRYYGGPADTWGGAIPASAFDGSFAVRIKTKLSGSKDQCGENPRDARIDRVFVTVQICVP